MLIRSCQNNLDDLYGLIAQLSGEDFTAPAQSLSGATLGQHSRHILEMYICMAKGLKTNEICYDKRERNILLETDVNEAIKAIAYIQAEISGFEDGEIFLIADYSQGENPVRLKSTVFRELAYNLEHTIHHQALIKVGLREMGKLHLIDENFGVAYSTIRFKKNLTLNISEQ